MLALRTPVYIKHHPHAGRGGKIVGRVKGPDPRYDVMLEEHTREVVLNLKPEQIETAA